MYGYFLGMHPTILSVQVQDLLVAQVLQSESTYAVMAVLNFTRIEDSKCKGQLLGHLGGEDYKEALDLTELT